MNRKLTTEEFIEKAKQIHGDKYDYSKVNYIKNLNKVCIICLEHGEFWQTPKNHLKGQGCPTCAKILRKKFFNNYDRTEINEGLKNAFFVKANEKHHNKYDYSKSEYVNSRTPISIICPEHGEFLMTPRQHLVGCGCYECGKENFLSKKKLGINGFTEKAKKIHGDKYDYSKAEYIDSLTKVCIICPEHGEFWQTPSAHIHLKEGCPRCNESHLEKKVRTFLEEKNIQFVSECSRDMFPWLELQTLDFYLPEYNIAIECQGRQHLSERAFSNKERKRDFEYQLNNDILKNKKCIDNGIKLYYIVDNIGYTMNTKIPIYNSENTFIGINEILNG